MDDNPAASRERCLLHPENKIWTCRIRNAFKR